jgi:hypothetical protein
MLSSRATMLALLQGSIAMSDALIIGILTIGVGSITSYFTSKLGAAEWKGASNQKFANIETKFKEIDNDQDNQWSEIRKATNGVARLDGELGANRNRKHQGQGT